jgi:hypothetical protein
MPRTRNLFIERINESHKRGRISDEILKSFYDRLPLLEGAVTAVETASGLPYPTIVFDPSLIKLKYPLTFTETIIYAYTGIEKLDGIYQLYVQVTLPFLLYAREDTLKACLAHEFLHYVFYTIILSKKDFSTLSGERLDAPEVHMAYDDTHIVAPEEWLRDTELVKLIKANFNPVISDKALEADVKSRWEDAKLPVRQLLAEESGLRIPILEVSKIPLDENIILLSKAKSR